MVSAGPASLVSTIASFPVRMPLDLNQHTYPLLSSLTALKVVFR